MTKKIGRLSRPEIEHKLSFAVRIAKGAGKILKAGFRRDPGIRYKGRIDPVTIYDLKSEKFIISAITHKFPDHAVLAEEGGGRTGPAAFRWIIDPLDGTVDYAHGFPVYCVSIGLEYNGKIVVGVVFDPERNECFTAGLGLGARLNGSKIKVSREKRVDRSLLATGFGYNIKSDRRNNLGYFARMAKVSQGIRRLGSAALDLCWLASGRIDGFWELHLKAWDTAAGKLIVEEAGGKISRFDGRKYSIYDNEILASNGVNHLALQRALKGK